MPFPDEPSEEDRAYREEIRQWQSEESGYSLIQGTRPQTPAYALTDSPAGLAAWIAEKFYVWTDHDGNVERAVDLDSLLTLPNYGCAASEFRPSVWWRVCWGVACLVASAPSVVPVLAGQVCLDSARLHRCDSSLGASYAHGCFSAQDMGPDRDAGGGDVCAGGCARRAR